MQRKTTTSVTPLRICVGIFASFLALALCAVIHFVLKLSARIDSLSGLRVEKQGGAHRIVDESTVAVLSSALAAKEAAAKEAAAKETMASVDAQVAALQAEVAALRAAAGATGRHGLQRLLSDNELDEMFRIRSELDSQLMGTADAESLLPYFKYIYGEHRRLRGPGLEDAGGFLDVGANIGDVSEGILSELSDHARRFYQHVLDPPGSGLPKLIDPTHPLYENQKLPFVYAMEPAAATRVLLERRALMGAWANSNFRLFPFACAATTGTAIFCAGNAGSGQSSLTGSENGGIIGKKEMALAEQKGVVVNCSTIETVTLVDLLDKQGAITKGKVARVFLLKIDVEGAEAVVLAGAATLFAAKRISYVLFENHAKWKATQEAIGVKNFVSVGDVVQQMMGFGYKCAYVTPWGLLPFEMPGTPSGDKSLPGCKEGLPFCARHRLYNRQVWSNVICGATPEEDLFWDWLSDALVGPYRKREDLLCAESQKHVCSSLK